jgi:hypothetical protein
MPIPSTLPDFEDLPFNERPDLTPYIVHLTKNSKTQDSYSAFDNLVSILKTGKIIGTKISGKIKGPHPATCFMDVPFGALKYVLNPRDSNPAKPRYEPYGVFVTKKYAHAHHCRPVLYLSDTEVVSLRIPQAELWRVVRFEVSTRGWISWLHEREWRCKGDFPMPSKVYGVLVKTASEADKLTKMLNKNASDFKVWPRSVIPLEVICQGFVKQ